MHFMQRPFSTLTEMNCELVKRNNEVVSPNDFVIHAGDFCWKGSAELIRSLQKSLVGNHIYLKGSHDNWMKGGCHEIWEKTIEGQHVVVCHYAMRIWGKSHWNSWQLYGHSHGKLKPIGKQYDVGVDCNNFYPVSFEQIKLIMAEKEDNEGLIKMNKDEL
jgi:calcineurin-like phosphoesterase family protein